MPIGRLVVGDIVQTIIESEVLGQRCLNVLYYRARSGMPTVTYFEAMDALNDAVLNGTVSSIVEAMVPLMGDNTKVKRVQSQRVYPSRDIYVRMAANVLGTVVELCRTPNIAFVITKTSELSGRGRNGSFHLAGVTDQHYTAGYVTEVGIGLLNTLGDKINDPQVADGGEFVFEPGMYHPGAGAGFNWHYMVGTNSQETVRVMRRRTVGLGQ